jgi:hypothetical protein
VDPTQKAVLLMTLYAVEQPQRTYWVPLQDILSPFSCFAYIGLREQLAPWVVSNQIIRRRDDRRLGELEWIWGPDVTIHTYPVDENGTVISFDHEDEEITLQEFFDEWEPGDAADEAAWHTNVQIQRPMITLVPPTTTIEQAVDRVGQWERLTKDDPLAGVDKP